MKTLVLANQKGGVGKSAIATQLAHYLHQLGRSVLVIDLDHQQNTSRPLRGNGNVTGASFSSSAIFESELPPALPSGRFVLIAGDDKLSGLERKPDQHNTFVTRFRAALKAWSRFDVCIIDTNPNPDIRYAASLISADYVLAPVQLNQEAIEGISGLLNHPRYGITRIAATLNPGLVLLGILPNMVEPTPFQRANLQLMMSKYAGRLLSQTGEGGPQFGYIPKRSAVAEAQAAGIFVPDMAKSAAREAWRDIKPVFDMIIGRLGLDAVVEASA